MKRSLPQMYPADLALPLRERDSPMASAVSYEMVEAVCNDLAAAGVEISTLLSRSSGEMRIPSGFRAQVIRQRDHPLQSKRCRPLSLAVQGATGMKGKSIHIP